MNPLEHVYQDACFQHAEEKKTWTSIEPEAPAQFWGRSGSISPLKSFHLQATDEISYALHQCSFNLRELGTTSRNPIIGVPLLRGNNTFTAWFLFIVFLFKEKIKHCGALTFFTSFEAYYSGLLSTEHPRNDSHMWFLVPVYIAKQPGTLLAPTNALLDCWVHFHTRHCFIYGKIKWAILSFPLDNVIMGQISFLFLHVFTLQRCYPGGTY